jgi:endogenous inhibitor of DNA gyrase (YacG/DUF329 family)
MHHTESSEATDSRQFASLFHCPNCEKPRVMSIKSIHHTLFRGEDLIVYKCPACGTEKTQTMK